MTLPGVRVHFPSEAIAEAIVLLERGGPAGEAVVHVPACEECCREMRDEAGVRVLVIVRRGG